MAKAYKHDASSTIGTVGTEAVKWGIGGIIAATVISAVVTVAAFALGGSVIGSIMAARAPDAAAVAKIAADGWSASGFAGSALTGAFAPITAIASVIGGAIYGGTGALIGAAFGVLKGGARVSDEKEAYKERMAGRQNVVGQEQSNAKVAGVQEGYMIGFQEGQQTVVNAIQQQMMQAQAMQAQEAQAAQAAAPSAAPTGATLVAAGAMQDTHAKVTADCETKCNTHVDALVKQREAAAIGAVQAI